MNKNFFCIFGNFKKNKSQNNILLTNHLFHESFQTTKTVVVASAIAVRGNTSAGCRCGLGDRTKNG